MAGKLFVFDLDDTLIDNVHDYTEPIIEMARCIIGALGSVAPHVFKVIAMEEEIDGRRRHETNPVTGKPYLYSMERFPGSCVETYREIVKRAKVVPDAKVEAKLWNIGMGAFDEGRYIKNVKPEALSVLDFLKKQGDRLVLLTAGDDRVQTKKVYALKEVGINHFEMVLFVDKKTSEDFKNLTAEFRGYKSFSVGNNYNSDILPALDEGFRGIFIPVETWEVIGKMDDIIAGVDSTKCTVIENLQDVERIYGDLG